MIKVLSLFSGIGAFENALRRIRQDYELVNYCEIDKYASKAYSLLYDVSEDLNLGDITKVDEMMLQDFDLMTWGFPCTDISVAGKQEGFTDKDGNKTRSGLYHEGMMILRYKKPKVSVIENVKNLTGKKFEKEFKMILDDLDNAGYNTYYKVLNAKDFGVPQNRERVFIVSIRKDIDLGLFEFPKPIELTLRLKDILEDEVDEKFYLSDEYMKRFLNSNLKMNGDIKILGTTVGTGKGTNSRHWVHDINGIVGALSATDYKQPKQILVEQNRLGGIFDTEKSRHQAGSIWDVNGLSPTLDTMQGGYRCPLIVASRGRYKEDGSTEQHFEPNYEGLCNTITTVQKDNYVLEPKSMIIDDTYGYDGVRLYDEYSPSLRASRSGLKTLDETYRLRKLTPRECWRLMGFTDEDFDKVSDVISNTQLYKMAGNSIVVNVLESIFKNLFESVSLEDD